MNKVFFVVLNLLISSCGYIFVWANVLFKIFLPQNIYLLWISVSDYAPLLYLGVPVLLLFSYWYFKIFLFVFLKNTVSKTSFITDFLSKYCEDVDFKKKVYKTTIVMDVAFIFLLTFIIVREDLHNYFISLFCMFFLWIIFGGGILISYFSYNKLTKNIKEISLINKILFLISSLIILISILFVCLPQDIENKNVNKYSLFNKVLNKAYGDKATKHFPKTLPENITDYYFEYEQSFHGYNLDYVKFSTDENYIKEIKKQSKCQKYDTKSNLYQQNIKIPLNDLGYDDKICIIDYQDYITGIAFKENTVFFFFQNYR